MPEDTKQVVAEIMQAEQDCINEINDCKSLDPEGAHVAADEALLFFIEKLGFTDVVEAYKKQKRRFWYA